MNYHAYSPTQHRMKRDLTSNASYALSKLDCQRCSIGLGGKWTGEDRDLLWWTCWVPASTPAHGHTSSPSINCLQDQTIVPTSYNEDRDRDREWPLTFLMDLEGPQSFEQLKALVKWSEEEVLLPKVGLWTPKLRFLGDPIEWTQPVDVPDEKEGHSLRFNLWQTQTVSH